MREGDSATRSGASPEAADRRIRRPARESRPGSGELESGWWRSPLERRPDESAPLERAPTDAAPTDAAPTDAAPTDAAPRPLEDPPTTTTAAAATATTGRASPGGRAAHMRTKRPPLATDLSLHPSRPPDLSLHPCGRTSQEGMLKRGGGPLGGLEPSAALSNPLRNLEPSAALPNQAGHDGIRGRMTSGSPAVLVPIDVSDVSDVGIGGSSESSQRSSHEGVVGGSSEQEREDAATTAATEMLMGIARVQLARAVNSPATHRPHEHGVPSSHACSPPRSGLPPRAASHGNIYHGGLLSPLERAASPLSSPSRHPNAMPASASSALAMPPLPPTAMSMSMASAMPPVSASAPAADQMIGASLMGERARWGGPLCRPGSPVVTEPVHLSPSLRHASLSPSASSTAFNRLPSSLGKGGEVNEQRVAGGGGGAANAVDTRANGSGGAGADVSGGGAQQIYVEAAEPPPYLARDTRVTDTRERPQSFAESSVGSTLNCAEAPAGRCVPRPATLVTRGRSFHEDGVTRGRSFHEDGLLRADTSHVPAHASRADSVLPTRTISRPSSYPTYSPSSYPSRSSPCNPINPMHVCSSSAGGSLKSGGGVATRSSNHSSPSNPMGSTLANPNPNPNPNPMGSTLALLELTGRRARALLARSTRTLSFGTRARALIDLNWCAVRAVCPARRRTYEPTAVIHPTGLIRRYRS